VTIPNFETLMLPLLKIAGDGKEHRVRSVVDRLQTQFVLSRHDHGRKVKRQNEPIFYNRVRWAKKYLLEAGLLCATRWAHFEITDRGKTILHKKPRSIDWKFLTRFREFNNYMARSIPKKRRGDGKR
jgi:restriction system protein